MRVRCVAWSVVSLVLLACEAGGTGDPSGADVAVGTPDAESGGPDAESPDVDDDTGPAGVPGPSAALESPLTPASVNALLPDLEGDDLIWYEAQPLPVEGEGDDAAAAAPVDCLACPGCGGCNWRLRHRNLATGVERVVSEQTYVQSAPRVGDGRIVWVRQDGQLGISDLETGAELTVGSNDGWFNAAPIPFDGALWWYGYVYSSGQSGLIRANADGSGSKVVATTYMNESWTVPSGSFSNFSRWQPFSLSDAGAVWTEWGAGSQRVRLWTFDGAVETVLEDPDRDYTSAVLLPGGAVVTKSYERAAGCSEAACHPEIRVFDGAAERVLSEGRPTVYGRPTVEDGRLFWFDFRDGPYTIWARDIDDPAAPAERVTSDEAVLGAAVPPTASAGRVVWMDRRDGIWRLYTKRL